MDFFRPTRHARMKPLMVEVLSHRCALPPKLTIDQWYDVYHYACDELIAPALLTTLELKNAQADIPADILDALVHIRSANLQRNHEAIAEYERLVNILASREIKVIPLKGIYRLQGKAEHNKNTSVGLDRMIRDIDVLIEPDSLPHALSALKKAGYVQAINRYQPSYYTKENIWQSIQLDDYRNSVSHSFHHVPVVTPSPESFGVDLHTRLNLENNKFTTYLEAQLLGTDLSNMQDTAAIEYQSAMLLHLIYHSQIRDGLLRLGRIDWRHIIDAKEILIQAEQTHKVGAASLTRHVLEVAQQYDLMPVVGCFFHQLDTIYPVDEARACFNHAEVNQSIKRFEKAQSSRFNYWLASLTHTATTRIRLYGNPSNWHYFFGPVSFLQTVLNGVRLLTAHLLQKFRR